MRKSQAEKIRDWKRKAGDPIRIGGGDRPPEVDLAEVMCGRPLLPTQTRFLLDPNRYKAYMGPAGCGKTVVGCASALSRALWQPGSVGVIAQHDYTDLMKSTWPTFQKLLNNLPAGVLLDRNKSPPMELTINPIGGGEPSKIMWLGLKDNLGGFEFQWAFLDEADKIDERAVRLVDGRMRGFGGGYSLMLAFNPPDKHHWLYSACTGRNYQDRRVGEPWVSLYEGNSRENVYLDTDYYDNLRKSYTPDMVQRLIDGEWGSTFEGSPVYREFKYAQHVRSDLKAQFDKFRPLLRFWDFGYRHPFCIWAQLDWEGRLLVMHEYMKENVEAQNFARMCKAETSLHFRDATDIIDYGDPAVNQQKDTGKALAVFAREGINIRFRSSRIEEGIGIIRRELDRTINGDPAMQFDRSCAVLIGAMRGGYRMDEKGVKPFKDNFYDHPADALRYGVINVLGGQVSTSYKLPESMEYDSRFDTRE